LRHKFAQEFQTLGGQLPAEKIYPRQVASRPSKIGDETTPDRVFGGHEYDRDCRGCRLGRKLGESGRDDHRDLPANQFGRQRRQPLPLVLGPPVIDGNVFTLDVAGLLEALTERSQAIRISVRRLAVEDPITGIAGCCARAITGHAAAAPPSSVMNSRRCNQII
jgi:hypothetical protein